VTPAELGQMVRDEATQLGFARVGFAPAQAWERHAFYASWLADGHAGEMAYLHDGSELRRSPAALLEGARTVVSVALSYAHPELVPVERLARGRIARYARGDDYHTVMKPRLARLAERVAERLGRPIAWRACVDTAHLLEREAASAAGVGFIAKNTLVIAPGLGSWLLLGELLVDVAIAGEDTSPESAPRCGRCRACLDACPTGAFTDAYTLDARRCISYLTIEHRGAIPRDLRPLMGDWIAGCDVCQEVCPFNQSECARSGGDARFAPAVERSLPSLVALLGMGAARFRKWVRRTALRRIHRAQLLRNVAVALGNVGGPAEVPALHAALQQETPLVRAHLAWALGQIAQRHKCQEATHVLLTHLHNEADAGVREEITLALDGR
jgi:epoxyqueuosine reductase